MKTKNDNKGSITVPIKILTLTSGIPVSRFFILGVVLALVFSGNYAYGADGGDFYGNGNMSGGEYFNEQNAANSGDNGTAGRDGAKGEDGKEVGFAIDGQDGEDGMNALNDAGKGGNAYGGIGYINNSFTKSGISLEFSYISLSGGNGGNGAKGGNGGKGGKAGWWLALLVPVNGVRGDGGNGGNGGDGGLAGNASGGAIYINNNATFEQSNVVFNHNVANGGHGGTDGDGGLGGEGGDNNKYVGNYGGNSGNAGNASSLKVDGGNAYGGAMYINADTFFIKSTVTFVGNEAKGGGGSNGGYDGKGYGQAIFVNNKTLNFNQGTTIFGENGLGAIVFANGNDAMINFNQGKVIITSHTSKVDFINDSKKMTFDPDIMGFYYNGTANTNNNFLIDFMKIEDIRNVSIWNNSIVQKDIEAVGNKSSNGGFLSFDNQAVTFNALGDVLENNAKNYGGAFYLSNKAEMTISASKDILFAQNLANEKPSDIYLTDSILILNSDNFDIKMQGGIQAVSESDVLINGENGGTFKFSGIYLFDNMGHFSVKSLNPIIVEDAIWTYSNNNASNGKWLNNSEISFIGKSQVVFSGNTGNVGSAIYLTGTAKMLFEVGVNLELRNNTVTADDGVIATVGDASNFEITNLIATDNKAVNGGALAFSNISMTFEHIIEISSNIAQDLGGAIFIENGASINISAIDSAVMFFANKMQNGNVLNDIYIKDINSQLNLNADVSIISMLSGIQAYEGSVISISAKNLLKISGVNVFDNLESFDIASNSKFEIDKANWTYSANQNMIVLDAGAMTFTNSTVIFESNSVGVAYGGAIYINFAGVLTFRDSDVNFSHNKSEIGGAIYATGGAQINFIGNSKVNFSGNTTSNVVDAYGGAIYLENAILKIDAGGNVDFKSNTRYSLSQMLPNDIYSRNSKINLIANAYEIRINSGIETIEGGELEIGKVSGAGQVILSGLNMFDNINTFKMVSAKMTVENSIFAYINNNNPIYLTQNSELNFNDNIIVVFTNNDGETIHIEEGSTLNMQSGAEFTSYMYPVAIYNAGLLKLDSSNGDIIFSGNDISFEGERYDIENVGTIDIVGNNNKVEMNDGVIANINGEINKSGQGEFLLKGDSFAYLGSFNQTEGMVIVSTNYFGGLSTINGGTLEFNNGTKLSSKDGFNIEVLKNAQILMTITQGEENDITIYNDNISGTGLINKTGDGHLYIEGDNSNFIGNFEQYAGTTTVKASGKLFGGYNFIKMSYLQIIADSVDYKVDISTQARLIHFGSGQLNNVISDDNIIFKGDDGQAIFTRLNQLRPKYVFSSVRDLGKANELIFLNVNVGLDKTDFKSIKTKIVFDNSRLDIKDIFDAKPKTLNFVNLQARNESDLDFTLLFVYDPAVPKTFTTLISDKLVVESGEGFFNIGNIRINNLEDSNLYDPVFPFPLNPTDVSTTIFTFYANDVLSGGLEFYHSSSMTIFGVNYNYLVMASSANDANSKFSGIRMDISVGAANRLYMANTALTGENRTFYHYPGSYKSSNGDFIGDYYIKQPMNAPMADGLGNSEYSHAGELFIIGARGEAENVHIYAIVHSTDGKSDYEGQRSHLFDLSADGDTQITIRHISISSASRDGSGGSVINMGGSAYNLSATIEDSIISSNESIGINGDGGAVFAATGTLKIDRSKFIKNTASGDGGSIYITGDNSAIIEDSIFENNNALGNGGAVYMKGSLINTANLEIRAINQDAIFNANTVGAPLAGALNDIYMDEYSQLTFLTQKNRKVIINSGIQTNANNLVVKKGDGQVQLAGDTNIRGTVNIEKGSIKAMKDITINDLNVLKEGTFVMANSTAAITTVGEVNIEGHFAVGVDVANGKSDLLKVNGTIEIDQNATLSVKLYSYGENLRVTIVQADHIDGMFGAFRDANTWEIIKPGIKRKYEVIYDNAHKWIDLDIETRSDFENTMGNLSHNQKEVSRILDAINEINVGEKLKDPIVDAMYVGDFQKAKRFLDELGGEFIVNAIRLAAMDNNSAIFERMSGKNINEKIKPYTYEGYVEASQGKKLKNKVWIQANMNGNVFKDKENLQGEFKSNGIGLLMGIDLYEKNNLWQEDKLRKTDKKIGIFLGVDQKNLKQGYDSADMYDFKLGLYAGLLSRKIDVKVSMSAGLQSYDTKRDLKFAQLKPQAEFNTYSIRGELEMSYLAKTIDEKLEFKPFLGVKGGYVVNERIEESKGDVSNLTIDSNEYSRASGQLGIKIENKKDGFSKFDWYAKAYMQMLMVGNVSKYNISLNGKDKMDIWGADEGIFSAGATIGANYKLTQKLSIFTNADFNIGEDMSAYYAGFGINYRFDKKVKIVEVVAIVAEHFEFDKDELSVSGQETIELLSERIKNAKYEAIIIRGHTDSVGTRRYNMGLAQRRANAVYNELMKKDINQDKLRLKVYGENLPIATNETEEGRALNRRVGIIIE